MANVAITISWLVWNPDHNTTVRSSAEQRFAPVGSHRESARANYALTPRRKTRAGKATPLAHLSTKSFAHPIAPAGVHHRTKIWQRMRRQKVPPPAASRVPNAAPAGAAGTWQVARRPGATAASHLGRPKTRSKAWPSDRNWSRLAPECSLGCCRCCRSQWDRPLASRASRAPTSAARRALRLTLARLI